MLLQTSVMLKHLHLETILNIVIVSCLGLKTSCVYDHKACRNTGIWIFDSYVVSSSPGKFLSHSSGVIVTWAWYFWWEDNRKTHFADKDLLSANAVKRRGFTVSVIDALFLILLLRIAGKVFWSSHKRAVFLWQDLRLFFISLFASPMICLLINF